MLKCGFGAMVRRKKKINKIRYFQPKNIQETHFDLKDILKVLQVQTNVKHP